MSEAKKVESSLYTVVKGEDGLWHVKTKSRNITQFKNSRKAWCQEWVIENDPDLKKLMAKAAI